MRKKNCWEVKQCGRQPGGNKEKEFGTCPAATSTEFSGVNNGVNGGRYCWNIAGTFCEFDIHGTFAKNIETCEKCYFYKLVRLEEGFEFKKLVNF